MPPVHPVKNAKYKTKPNAKKQKYKIQKVKYKYQVSPGDGGTYLCLATYADSPFKAEVEVSVFSEYPLSFS